jgi:hypothetical protein
MTKDLNASAQKFKLGMPSPFKADTVLKLFSPINTKANITEGLS